MKLVEVVRRNNRYHYFCEKCSDKNGHQTNHVHGGVCLGSRVSHCPFDEGEQIELVLGQKGLEVELKYRGVDITKSP